MAARPPVLLIGDDPVVLSTLGQLLGENGHPTLIADSGPEALEIVRGLPRCVVLLDMQMAVFDGWAFAREVHARRRDFKIVVMTTDPQPKACADRIAADGFVAKPVVIEEVLAEIARVQPA